MSKGPCGKYMPYRDMTGEIFHYLTVLSRSHSDGKRVFWNVQCKCGVRKTVRGCSLREGKTKSCGDCARHDPRPRRKEIRLTDDKKYMSDLHHKNHLERRSSGLSGIYQELMLKQNGLCAICLRPNASGKRLAVDHSHSTNEYRGLLCDPCNRALGMFQDSIEILASASAYLREYS